jgi:hypothetical protein
MSGRREGILFISLSILISIRSLYRKLSCITYMKITFYFKSLYLEKQSLFFIEVKVLKNLDSASVSSSVGCEQARFTGDNN